MKADALEKQLEAVLDDFHLLRSQSIQNDLSDKPKHERQALVSRMVAAVHRLSGTNSTYSQEIDRLLKQFPYLHDHTTSIAGVATALLADLKAGYVQSLAELIHGAIFGDFLEMAEHLNGTGYKDAAAVISGSTLEIHLRELCQKAGITIEDQKPDGSLVQKKADRLNSDLGSSGSYSKLDQKNVTAWLDLRNKAAHGKYSEYSTEQVILLIAGIRDFVTRNPA